MPFIKHWELGLAVRYLGSWCCVLWNKNKLPLSKVSSFVRYNGHTAFGLGCPAKDSLRKARQKVKSRFRAQKPVRMSSLVPPTTPHLPSALDGTKTQSGSACPAKSCHTRFFTRRSWYIDAAFVPQTHAFYYHSFPTVPS